MRIDHSGIKKILIINLAFIGDVLLSTPVARALRRAYPEAKIDMLVIPLAAEIAKGNPYVNDVFVYDKKGKHKKIGELFKLIGQIRKQYYDMAIATNFASRGAMLAWACGIRYRLGYDIQHGGLFLTHAVRAVRLANRHEAENYLDVLEPLGISLEDTSLALQIDPGDSKALHEKVTIDQGKPTVVICPIGSYPQKSWTISGFAELIRSITPACNCFLIGAKSDADKLKKINSAAGNSAVVLAGTLSLGEVAALLAEARLLVTVDTGPMHIADAVGTPVVALFGPTDPQIWGPRGANATVLRHVVPCTPCWGKTECAQVECMTGISIQQVLSAVEQVVAR
jgi:predicted lipopolysaccharide heptosyltransferase III